jgi:hypothetical protein
VRKTILLSLVTLFMSQAFAGATDADFIMTCSDQNRAPVLFVLNRVGQEMAMAGQDTSGVRALASMVRDNSRLDVSADTLRRAGLSDLQVQEVLKSLRIEE